MGTCQRFTLSDMDDVNFSDFTASAISLEIAELRGY